ncbi:MAG: SPOR domain-containing protein [Pseudomonadales bacterium]
MNFCRTISVVCVLIFLSFSVQTHGKDYTIQIGVFTKPSATYWRAAAEVDTVYHYSKNGLTKVQVGFFDKARDAQTSLEKLRSVGYQDAFIVAASKPDLTQVEQQDNTSDDQAIARTASPHNNIAWQNLSEDERTKAAYLDGQLRIKVGDVFYTVSEYRSSVH